MEERVKQRKDLKSKDNQKFTSHVDKAGGEQDIGFCRQERKIERHENGDQEDETTG